MVTNKALFLTKHNNKITEISDLYLVSLRSIQSMTVGTQPQFGSSKNQTEFLVLHHL